MTSCSIVTVTYYTGPVLFAALKTMLQQKQLTELIIVDNGNPPEVLTRLQQMSLTEQRITIITGHGNVGYAKACNIGAAKATGDYLLLLDPDCLLPPDTIADMATAFESAPNAMLAGCRLENPDGSKQRSGSQLLLTPTTAIKQNVGIYRLTRFNQYDTLLPTEEPFELMTISSTFMFLRRSDYKRLYGLDEGYFLYAENCDFCMRVHNAGGKVICVPRVRVTRMNSAGKSSARFLEWQKAKGFRRYFNKYFQGEYLPGVLALINVAILAHFAWRITIGELKKKLYSSALTKTLASRRLMVLASGLAELPETRTMQGKTVLVTGATGQVGLCVVRRLLAAGATVFALSRSDAIPFNHEKLHWVKGDLRDKSLHLGDCRADAVVHCVPLWYLLPNMTTLAETGAKRVIVFSSTSVFAKALSKNEFEKTVVRNLSQAEAAFTESCQANSSALTILRPTLIYGVGLDENITALVRFIRRFGFFPIYPPAFGRRQPVHADDLAIAVLHIMSSEKTYGRSYNVSGGEIITYRAMLERLFKALDRKPRIISTTLLPLAIDMAGTLLRKKDLSGEIARRMNDDLIFFHDDARKDFGFNPRPFLSSGIRDIEGF